MKKIVKSTCCHFGKIFELYNAVNNCIFATIYKDNEITPKFSLHHNRFFERHFQ